MNTLPSTTAAVPTIDRVDHLHIQVTDRAAAVAWYGRVMGLRPVAALAHWAVDGGPLTLADGSGTLHLALFERPSPAPRGTVALGTDAAGFRQWQQHLARRFNPAPAVVDHGLSWSLYFSDPDGNPYEITCTEVSALHA